MKKTDLKKAQKLVQNILSFVDLDSDQVEILDDGEQLQVQISIPEEESGVFIGYHGETISSLQLILALIISQRLGDWYPVRVNVGDYQERRQEALFKKADQAVEKAVSLQQEVVLPNLNAYERRLIHSHLQDNDQVTTESRGQEPFRQLIIVPNL